MKKIFIGLLLCFLDLNIGSGTFQIDFLPDILGFILIILGLNELSVLSVYFGKAKLFTVLSLFFSLLFGLVGFLGILSPFILKPIEALIGNILLLSMSWYIIKGMLDYEVAFQKDILARSLKTVFKWFAGLIVATSLLLAIPALSFFAGIGAFLVYIFFLISFYKSMKLFYATKE